jgi:transposase-like protein
MLLCQECKSYFAETHGTVISGSGTPLSEIMKVLKNRMEGMGLNAAARTFGYSKKTIFN